jgi:hypothetical protein
MLTVHLGIILVNDQLDAQFFFLIRLFQSSACFEQPRAHHQENKLCQYNFWYMALLCKRPYSMLVGKFRTCILYGHLHRVPYTRSCIDTIDSLDDEHEVAKHVKDWNKHVRKKNCASSWSFTRIKRCTYNTTLRSVRVTTVAVDKQ